MVEIQTFGSAIKAMRKVDCDIRLLENSSCLTQGEANKNCHPVSLVIYSF